MTLRRRMIDIPLGAGVDEGTHPHLVQSPMMASVKNARFSEDGVVSKRYGFDSLNATGSASEDANSVFDHHGQLAKLHFGGVYTYSETATRWRRTSKAGIYPCDINNTPVVRPDTRPANGDGCWVNGFVATVWDDGTDTYVMTREAATGVIVIPPTLIASMGTKPRVVAIDGTDFVIFAVTAARVLKAAVIDTSSTPTTIGAAATIDLDGQSGVDDFDADSEPSKAHCGVICRNGNVTNVYKVDAALATVASVTGQVGSYISSAGATIYWNPDTARYICGTSGTAAAIYCWYVSEDFTTTAPSTANLVLASTGAGKPKRLTITKRDDSGGNWLAVSSAFAAPFAGEFVHNVEYADLDTTAALVAGTTGVEYNMRLATKAFRESGHTPMVGARLSMVDEAAAGDPSVYVTDPDHAYPTGFILSRWSDAASVEHLKVVARFHQDRVSVNADDDRCIPEVYSPSTDEWRCARTIRTGLRATVDISSQGIDEFTITLDPEPRAIVPIRRGSFISGGYVGNFDGDTSMESAIHTAPARPIITMTGTGGSSSWIGVVVRYQLVYVFEDANGETHRSPPSPIADRTIIAAATGSENDLTLEFQAPPLSGVDDSTDRLVAVEVYRTNPSEPSDSSFYLRARINDGATANAWIWSYNEVAFATVNVNPVIYTTGGVLASEPPPAVHDLISHQQRLFAISGEDRSVVWFTKVITGTTVPEWNSQLTIEIPEGESDLVAMWSLGDRLILATSDRLYYVTGEGPNNLGQGGSFSRPRLLTSDVGCTTKNSVVTGPFGAMFQTRAGIYLLDPALSLSFIGKPIEDTLGTTVVQSAVLVASQNQVRFLLGNSAALVFDYRVGMWSTWTDFPALDACMWNGSYTRIGATSTSSRENTTLYTDLSVRVALEMVTAWIKLAGLQGFQRVRRAMFLGIWDSEDVQISVGYDYDDSTYPTARTWTAAEVTSLTPLQLAIHIDQQKSQSIRFKFSDAPIIPQTPPTAGAGWRLSALTLEVGVKRGRFKGMDATTQVK